MNEELLEKVMQCPKLPTLPAVAVRVVELTGDERVTMTQLAETIQNDQGLASRILKTVNSAFYGLRKPCATLTQAQIMLGLNAVKTLALGFTLVDAIGTKSESTFDFMDYWRRGLYTGVGARQIAIKTKLCDPEEAFLGGLMQDIGMVALHAELGEEYARLVNSCPHTELTRREIEQYEISHALVGSMLAERWNLPTTLRMSIRHHERPTAAPPEHQELIKAVGLGNHAAAVLVATNPASVVDRYTERAAKWYGLGRADVEDMLERTVTAAKEVGRVLDLPGGKFPRVAEIFEKANDRLVHMALKSDLEVERSSRQAAVQEHAATCDELTGLANSAGFLAALRQAFESAEHDNGATFAVVCLDLDHLGALNDDLGRAVGDIVLQRLGQRLAAHFAGSSPLVARYGGDEFSVLLTGVGRAAAAGAAEAFRQSLITAPIDMTGCDGAPGELQIKVSVGVAALEPASRHAFTRVEQVLHAADQAMRAARAAGGDCVRAFAPRKAA